MRGLQDHPGGHMRSLQEAPDRCSSSMTALRGMIGTMDQVRKLFVYLLGALVVSKVSAVDI